MTLFQHQDCTDCRARLESLNASLRDADPATDPLLARHLAACSSCAEYADLQQWSLRTLRAAELHAQPPLMSAVWASIHRASEQAWDYSLSRSFRNLLPYMVAFVALIALLGGLTSGGGNAVQAATSAFSSFNQPEPAAVANVLSTTNIPSQEPGALLGVAHRH